MWAIFLLASLTTAIVTLVIIYIGHRVIMAIENERANNKIKNKKRGKKK